MLPCGIWKIPYDLREFTHHYHEEAQIMNFHLEGAQNPTRSAGLGRDRSEVRSRKALFQTQNSRCSANHSFKCHHGPCFWSMMSETPPYMWLRWPHGSLLRSQTRKMATRTLEPTSSAESGGHLPRCQTPARGRNDKIRTKGKKEETRGGRHTEPQQHAAALQSLNHQRLI